MNKIVSIYILSIITFSLQGAELRTEQSGDAVAVHALLGLSNVDPAVPMLLNLSHEREDHADERNRIIGDEDRLLKQYLEQKVKEQVNGMNKELEQKGVHHKQKELGEEYERFVDDILSQSCISQSERTRPSDRKKNKLEAKQTEYFQELGLDAVSTGSFVTKFQIYRKALIRFKYEHLSRRPVINQLRKTEIPSSKKAKKNRSSKPHQPVEDSELYDKIEDVYFFCAEDMKGLDTLQRKALEINPNLLKIDSSYSVSRASSVRIGRSPTQ
jgi:hypothetical protein